MKASSTKASFTKASLKKASSTSPDIKPLVYTVVVHYNRLDDTLECLECLEQQTYPNQRILFVDNDSKDNGPQAVAEKYPGVEQLLNGANLGFTGGYNAGMCYALEHGADFVYIINNDTTLNAEHVELLVQACQQQGVGAVSPIIYYHAAPDQIWSAGGKMSPFTLDMTDNHGRGQTFTEITERDFLSGCAMMFPRAVIEKVGMFDDDFFWYYEDSDLSFRVRKAGFKQLLVPQAKMWHKVSQTGGGEDNPTERYYMARNSFRFFRKHAVWWQWFFIAPYRFASIIRTILRLISKKKSDSLRSYLRGLREGFFTKPTP